MFCRMPVNRYNSIFRCAWHSFFWFFCVLCFALFLYSTRMSFYIDMRSVEEARFLKKGGDLIRGILLDLCSCSTIETLNSVF